MSTHGKLLQHGKPQRWEARSQLDAREGQAGPSGVADRLVVPRKPGNAGGGKGPEFKEAVRRGKGQGEWCKPMNLPNKTFKIRRRQPTEFTRSNACALCFLVREPDAGNPHVLVVCPEKADVLSGSQSRRGKSRNPRSLDGRQEGNRMS
jgi:hypothetical protein